MLLEMDRQIDGWMDRVRETGRKKEGAEEGADDHSSTAPHYSTPN